MDQNFKEEDIEKKIFKDRWVRFAFGPQGKIDSDSLNLGIVEFEKNRESMEHEHEVEEALYVLYGKGKIKIGQKIHNVEKGEFAYIPKNRKHLIITGECKLKIMFIFGGKIVIDY